MKVGIIGPAKRAVAWENHLAGHRSVSEIVIAADIDKATAIDACVLLHDDLNEALQAIKNGIHCFIVAKLPTDIAAIERLYYTSEEAGVRLQFSHWSTLSPAAQWISNQIPAPSFIQTNHWIDHTYFLENDITLHSLLIDDLAYCLKYINSSVHQISHNNSKLSSNPIATHLMLRFDNRSTACIYINTAADENHHQRFISDNNFLIDYEVKPQRIRMGRKSNEGPLFFDHKKFDPSTTAEQAVIKFLKAIQLKKPTLYNGYDLLHLAKTIKKIRE